MKCPSCKHQFRLTFREYFRELRGRHDCPACQRRFKLKYSFSYISLLLIACLITAGVPGVLVGYFADSFMIGLLAYSLAVVLFVFPIDRWLDDTWRESAEV
jgi:uncharacterized membrane protein SpoIIM required for sporulation